jgi:hypothetical protein
MKMHPVRTDLLHTDRWETDMTKLIVAVLNFENAPNTHQSSILWFKFASRHFKPSTCHTAKKLKLPECLIKLHSMNVYRKSGSTAILILK